MASSAEVKPLCDQLAALPGGGPLAAAVRHLSEELDAARRALKLQAINHSTIIEIANRVNDSGFNLSQIEGYVSSMIRGQFAVMHVYLWRVAPGETAHLRTFSTTRGALTKLAIRIDSAFGGWCRDQRTVITGDQLDALAVLHPEAAELRNGGVDVVVPLVNATGKGRHELIGLLALGRRMGDVLWDTKKLELLRLLSDMVAIAINNAQLYHLSIMDNLTQVYSRGHFDVQLGKEIARCGRHLRQLTVEASSMADGTRLSLIMIDIDHFKSVNDTHGHPMGDVVLRCVGAMLKESLRVVDIVSRYGGEEFAIVLPETPRGGAMLVAERIRSRFHELQCVTPAGKQLPVTASLGVATWPDDAQDVRQLIVVADQALYRAKQSGRDRVGVASDANSDAVY